MQHGAAPLEGPSIGGKVLLFRGGFFFRNGAVVYGTFPNQVPGCSNDIDVNFVPPAGDVTFTLMSFTAQTVQVFAGSITPTSYSFSQAGAVTVHIPDLIAGLSIQASHGYGITGLTITQHPLNRGFVQFDLAASIPPTADQAKILLSKAAWDVGFPSSAQLAPDSSGNPQMKITGSLIDLVTGQPKSGPVYLRVEDPADTAAYRGGDAHADDNDGPPASLVSTTVQADSQGQFEATLVIHSHVAGDNYRVVGSADQNFNCGAPCPRSAVLTLWKRIYVEQENMFVKGAFVDDFAAHGTTMIPVDDPTPFRQLSPGSRLEMVHAGTDGFYFEFVTFSGLLQSPGGNWLVQIDPASAPTRDYGDPNKSPGTIAALQRDGIGVVAEGTYESNDEYVGSLLSSAFVESRPAKQTVVEVPYVPDCDDLKRIYFSSWWLQDGLARDARVPFVRSTNPNVYHRIAAAQAPPKYANTPQPGWGLELGATSVSGTNSTMVFAQRIRDLTAGRIPIAPDGRPMGAEYSGLNELFVNGETTAHEAVHLWVHTGGADNTGHCAAQSYANANLNCLMHTPYTDRTLGLADGIVDMHYTNHGADSEYMTIRRATDPVPLQ